MRLKDIMRTGIVTIEPGDSVRDARATMRRHRIRHLVVVDGGRVVGIVSERDFGRAGRQDNATVQDVMSTDVVSATPATTLRQAANLMRGHTIGCLLVVDEDKLLGLVTTTDLLDQLGRGATRPKVRIEEPPLRRPPGSGAIPGGRSVRGPTGPRKGRRPRTPAAERLPLPTALPRPAKLARDRTSGLLPPAHIRVIGAEIADADRDHISRKLGMKLGKFASSIERVTVRLTDANGPKGGRDQVCNIKVVLSGLPSVVVEERDSRFQRAVSRAINSTALAVRSTVRRRRMKPLRNRVSAARAGALM
jgi:acetoin utilization protein AcuB